LDKIDSGAQQSFSAIYLAAGAGLNAEAQRPKSPMYRPDKN
jgi:hypothetical protein